MKTVILTILLILTASATWVSAAELLVPSQYPTIQSAINDANNGDTIIVAPGTYISGGEGISFLGKAITVKSENGPETCIIDCQNSGRGFQIYNSEDTNSVIIGFTITNGHIYRGGGVYCQGNLTIINCNITANYSFYGGAIYCEDSNLVIADCNISGNLGDGGGIYCQYSSVTINDCVISKNYNYDDLGGGIFVRGSLCHIYDSAICDNYTDGEGGGIRCEDSNAIITGCTITGNSTGWRGGAILCRGSSAAINNCTFAGNSASDGNALACDSYSSSSDIQLTNCILWNGGDEIWNNDGSTITITYSDVQSGWPGIGNIDSDPCFVFSGDYHLLPASLCVNAGDPNYVPEPNETDLDGNPRVVDGRIDMGAYEYQPNYPLIFISPSSFTFSCMQDGPQPDSQSLFIRNVGGGILCWEIIEDCNWLDVSPAVGVSTGQINEVALMVDQNSLKTGSYSCVLTVIDPNAVNSPVLVDVDLRVSGPIYVPGDFPTIQQAIDAAEDNDTVIVADGTYTGLGNRDIDFLGKAITVCSESGPETCIIDCQSSGSGFCFNNGEDANSVVGGFTITNGYTNRGGIIYCQGSSPTIINCNITNNETTEDWWNNGGISCSGGSPEIKNCSITGNSSKGISCDGECSITSCTIAGNGGCGIYCAEMSSPVITNCTIAGNRYDGICFTPVCSSAVNNCTIAGNRGYGISFYFLCSSAINNCTITGNRGCGIYFDSGFSLAITNCTISNNSTDDGGNIIEILIWNDDDSNITVTYSDVQGGWPGLANIDIDPCFVEPGYWDANGTPANPYDDFWVDGDYHLKSAGWRWDTTRQQWDWDDVTSRCIDAGNPGSPLADEPLSVPEDPNNIWGQNLRINMGAYGGTAQASIPPYDWAILADLTNDGLVDLTDYAYQAAGWLNSADAQPGDLNRDSLIDISDLALLTDDWLKYTSWNQ